MTRSTRLDRLVGGLNAVQRAVAVVRRFKESGTVDQEVCRSTPAEQAAEFTYYINLVNGVNDGLSANLNLLQMLLDPLNYILGWYSTHATWAEDADVIGNIVYLHMKEPIREEDYETRRATARAEMLSMETAARERAMRVTGWRGEYPLLDDEVRDFAESSKGRGATAKAEKELLGLIKKGVIPSEHRDGELVIAAGDLYDFLGEEVPLRPDWGREHEVIPKGNLVRQFITIEVRRKLRELLHAAPVARRGSIWRRTSDMNDQAHDEPVTSDPQMALLQEDFTTRFNFAWREMRAIEAVVMDVASELAGEDPALPDMRVKLDAVRADLTRMFAVTSPLMAGVQLEEPSPDEIEIKRRLLKAGEKPAERPTDGPSEFRSV